MISLKELRTETPSNAVAVIQCITSSIYSDEVIAVGLVQMQVNSKQIIAPVIKEYLFTGDYEVRTALWKRCLRYRPGNIDEILGCDAMVKNALDEGAEATGKESFKS